MDCPVEICSDTLRNRVLADAAAGNQRRQPPKKKNWIKKTVKVLRKKKTKPYNALAIAKSSDDSQHQWLHPQHHIETGVEYEAEYVGSAIIADKVNTSNACQDAVLQLARTAYDQAPFAPPDSAATIDVSSTDVTVTNASGAQIMRYKLDMVPFASCDIDDPKKIYFVTMPKNGISMMHLFEVTDPQDGLEFTFTVAQAFHVRWNVIQTKTKNGSTRRVTSPTGAVGRRRPLSVVVVLHEPPASLGTKSFVRRAWSDDDKISTEAEDDIISDEGLRGDSDYLDVGHVDDVDI